MILFKNLLMLRAAIKAKMPLTEVQIAGLGAKADSVQVFHTVHITQAEAEMPMHYHTTRNLNVYFQAEPQENAVPLHTVVATYFPELDQIAVFFGRLFFLNEIDQISTGFDLNFV